MDGEDGMRSAGGSVHSGGGNCSIADPQMQLCLQHKTAIDSGNV